MKEIVVISGKGGTGKTSITASFAMLGGNDVIVGDCDVDAADMHLLLEPDFATQEDFYSGQKAVINMKDCSLCGVCEDVCRFDAIKQNHSGFTVNTMNCEGCGYCSRVCPDDAIEMKEQLAGKTYISKIKTGSIMVHARLGIGAENSGKLVAKVKKEAVRIAKELNKEFVIIDGSPGIGCPVMSSLVGAHFVIIVTEPSISGFHDLKRVYELINKFNINTACIINKYDINLEYTKKIKNFLEKENILHLCNLPYDESFTKAMTLGKTIIEYDKGIIKSLIVKSWKKIIELN